jgi:hypothetical protein
MGQLRAIAVLVPLREVSFEAAECSAVELVRVEAGQENLEPDKRSSIHRRGAASGTGFGRT